MKLNRFFAMVGIFVTLAFLGGVAWNRLEFIRADQARIEGVEAAGVGLLAAFVALGILYYYVRTLLPKGRQLRSTKD